jgi:hypothetical protein
MKKPDVIEPSGHKPPYLEGAPIEPKPQRLTKIEYPKGSVPY